MTTNIEQTQEAISVYDALKLAHEALVDNRHYITANERTEYLEIYDKAIDVVEKALAHAPSEREQPAPVAKPHEQQEPVAYDKTEINCFAQDLYDQKMREGKRGHYESMFHVIHQCIKKVSPQPSKPWAGLTDEEIEKGRDQTFSINNPYCPCDSKTMRKAVRWAEAKLREKNA